MTKEENIATLNEHLEHWKRLLSEKICNQSEGEKTIDALQNAIKALEQEPCEVSQGLVKDSQGFSQEPCDDAISRQAVMDGLISIAKTKAKSDAQKSLMGRVMFFVEKLPSVTPQPKMGRWITWKEADNIIPSETRFECSVCHDAAYTLCNGLDLLSPYCPNCGAKMQDVEE